MRDLGHFNKGCMIPALLTYFYNVKFQINNNSIITFNFKYNKEHPDLVQTMKFDEKMFV